MRYLFLLLLVGALLLLAGPERTEPAEAQFPGTNGRIAFGRDGDIWLVDPDGQNEEQLTQGAALDNFPAWSPDGQKISFTRAIPNSQNSYDNDIWVMNADGTNEHQVTDGHREGASRWSPDGTEIVFWGNSAGPTSTFIMNADGTNRRNLTPGGFGSFPSFSPDGTKIAYSGGDLGTLWTMNPDGSGKQEVLAVTGITPDWAPDGQSIAFTHSEGTNNSFVYIIESGSTNPKIMTSTHLSAWPSWSPDGEFIAYVDTSPGSTMIHIMDADGGNKHAIVQGTQPAWGANRGLIDSVEFTQAIQQWQSIGELKEDLEDDGEPPVPIVAGKPAAMRVYFSQLEQSIAYDVEITGVAEDEQRASLGVDCTPEQRRERKDQCRSVDFFFTPPPGDWSVTLNIKDVGGEQLESHTFDLRSVTMSTITVVPVDVCDHQTVPVIGSWDCGYGFNLYGLAPYLHATFPGQVQFAATGGQVYENTSTGDSAWWSTILSELDDLRNAADVDDLTFYHGSVRGAAPSIQGIAGMGRRPGSVAATNAGLFYSDTYMTHELGHNFGREHVPSLGESGCGSPAHPDPNWPGFSPHIDEVGFSVVADVELLTDEVKDYMSYCQPVWVSTYTYLGILERFRTTNVAQGSSSGSVAGNYWLISGEIDGTAATLGAVEIEASATAGEGTGAYAVEARDAGGTVLATRRFDAAEGEWEGGTTSPRFSVMLPVMAGAARLVLVGPGDAELGEIVFEGSAPTVSITAPTVPQTLVDTFALEWSTTDDDGGTHLSWVEYSIDGGATWDMLTPRIDGTSLVLDSATLAGSSSAMFKVIVSDGANTGSATAGPFSIPEKGPQAQITAPTNHSFRDGQLVWLQGVAFDEDDGFLDDTSVTWSSSKDGALGSGASLPVYDLSNGAHTITMTARDSDNNAATDTVNISISDQPIVEGEEPGAQRVWGDNDCSGSIGSRDGQAISRVVLAQNALSQTQPCPALGDVVTVNGAQRVWGDIDCNGAIGARDGQALLRNVLGQAPLSQTQPCPAIGDTVAVVGAALVSVRRAWW
jgi:Tol biopolymer transport system component